MKLEIDANVIAVCKRYPFAYRISDTDGFYIINGTDPSASKCEVLGKGRNPMKAWKNAASNLKKTKSPGRKTPKRKPKK